MRLRAQLVVLWGPWSISATTVAVQQQQDGDVRAGLHCLSVFFFFSAFTSALSYLPPLQQIEQFQVNMAAEQGHKDNDVFATVDISG